MADRELVLIEEDAAEADRLIAQIGQFGYTVRKIDGVESLGKTEGVAALLVAVLSDEDGWHNIATLENFRSDGTSLPPVILLARELELPVRIKAARAGAAAFLNRPVNVLELIDAIDGLQEQTEGEPYRVLIIDDDTGLSSYHKSVLEDAGVKVEVVHDPLTALPPLVDFRPELIVMDLYMPNCHGKELAAAIRQENAYLPIPIVFLSAEDDTSKQLDAMTIGGDEFLVKPIHPEYLIAAVITRAKRFRALRGLMVRDSLTGLLNHTTTNEQTKIELARARRINNSLTFALLDIDHFKLVNDRYGHPAGDRVIKSLSNLLKQRLRATDVIGRYGGEEFAVVLPDADADMASKIIDEVRQSFADIHHQHDDGDFVVTLSGGIATFPQCSEVPHLIDAADKALYRAKSDGRNQVLRAGAPAAS
jgi:diguanylate cyclase (GGDEF)-like protein